MKDTNRQKRGSALEDIAADRHRMEMTPMIDVTFLLLIFFMCTLQFRTLEGQLHTHLPKDIGAGRAHAEAEILRIQLGVLEPGTRVRFDPELGRERPATAAELAAGLRFRFGDDRVIEYAIGAATTTDLGAVLSKVEAADAAQRAAGLTEGARVEIDARPGTTHGDVVRVLDGVTGLGITRVQFRGPREL